MSDTLIFAPTLVRRPEPREREPRTTKMPGRPFADRLVVEVLSKVPADFRQSEASMLGIVDAALARGGGLSEQELLNLRARMHRYSREVDVLGALIAALVKGLGALAGAPQKMPGNSRDVRDA